MHLFKSFLFKLGLATLVNLLFAGQIVFAQSFDFPDSLEAELAAAQLTKHLSETNDSLQTIDLLYNYSVYLDEKGDLEGSTLYMEKALSTAVAIQDNRQIARVGNYLATNYLMLGQVDISITTYNLALKHAEQTNDYSEIAKISMNLAENYNFIGDYKNAIKFGLNSLKIKESEQDWERICYHYMAMSNIFKETGDLDKREEYILLAYQMKDKHDCSVPSDVAKIYNGLGGVAQQRSQYKKALAYYDTLKVYCEEHDFAQGINTALTNSALIYQEQQNYEKALDLILESEKYAHETPYDTIFADNCKTELYRSLNEPEKALELAMKNFRRHELVFYSAEHLKCLEFLYEINFQLKNYQDAYRWNDSLWIYRDSLSNQGVRTAIADLEMQYQTEKKEQQIALLQAENRIEQQKKLVYIAISLVLLLLVVIGTLLYFKNKRENQIHRLELRQQLLRSQMNPHFLFNALGSIQNFMYKNETKKAATYLGNFARLTRSILEHSAEEQIMLCDEIDLLKNYLELEKMRAKGGFNYRIQIADEMDTEFVKIPPMLIQPFVENAVKHGLRNINYPGELLLAFSETEDELHVTVKDNGHGIGKTTGKKNQNKSHRSMSMEIFKERQAIMLRRYKKQIQFIVSDLSMASPREKGTEVKLTIPL
ncbi:histidine kinase [uncultured Draconibacterium sp.]|uniref:tetratricopeptide repeat-containing sensor histidine kinase n=1 Tax=uncultured Draconibacterium sp. TaxID=1573823 RepID=UPI0025F7D22F|nr:histidine kinase [uncultured Draconibacterium sp.]